MIYSNDEQDKKARQRNHAIAVNALPAIGVLLICGLDYLAYHKGLAGLLELYFGCILSPIAGFLIWQYNSSKWLKMPDGTYYNINAIQPAQNTQAAAPDKYEQEYYFSKPANWVTVVLGICIIVAAALLWLRTKMGVMISIVFASGGFVYLIKGIIAILNRAPQLKLDPKGVWTKQLGFVPWKAIQNARVVITKSDKNHSRSETILKIYLRGTVFAGAGQPDEALYLTDIANNNQVQSAIEKFMQNAASATAQ